MILELPVRARARTGPDVTTLLTAGLGIAGWLAGLSRLLWDSSFLTHLRTGHWILAHHAVPRHDLYSFTAPHETWVSQSWLAEVVYAVADGAAGPLGVRLVNAATGAAIAVLAHRLALRLAGNAAAATLVTIGSLLVSASMWSSRPLLFGVLAMLLVVRLAGEPGREWWLPVVLWFWANTHGSFVLGFGYLLLYLPGSRRLRLPLPAAAAGCLVNPYAWRLPWFPFHLMGRGDFLRHVDEWTSPDFTSPQGICLALWLCCVLAVLGLASRRPGVRDVLVLAVFTGLALWAQRNIALAPVAGLPILARLAARPPARTPAAHRAHLAVLAVLLLLGGALTARTARHPAADLGRYPVAAMRTVEARGLLGRRLVTTDVWGGYLISRYWPRQRVFMDDRYDMYPVPHLWDYAALASGGPRWRSVLDGARADLVVWPAGDHLALLLAADPAWDQIYRDRTAVVFER